MNIPDSAVIHLKPCQVAERWRVTEGTLERWRTQGLGPVYVTLPRFDVHQEMQK